MNLRRSMATAAAAAVIAPLALLSAPAAFAEEGGTSSPSASSSETGASSPSASASDGQSASGDSTDASSASSSPSDGQKASGSPSGSASSSSSSSSSSGSTASPSATESGDAFDPYQDCDSFDLDEKLSAHVKGLPSKIVAGSGWHGFTFVVDNDSDRDLKNVYIDAFLEYGDESTEAFLSEGLAVIQVKEDGKWTNSFQDSFEDEHGKSVNVTGSFVGLLDTLEKHSSASLELRVKVKAAAPAGSALALSEAVYAGEGAACYGNGDFYDVRILAAGSDADGSGDAKPNGDKPTSGARPQGSAKPISGSLAETGSDSSLPVIGLVGGVAVLAGAGAVFAARRRKVGTHA
ncbi:LAETG motif-containing sortase-dependent surface protein [Streptomyces sp. FL07-04A]|uniref:LAETG motif-containing sortase-dependent surface protein n=1 Tax=Streptomyces sp. FL07-04A TaxID=3028658 RepID=UPI0029AE2FFB|nr:LAETG motif-containing sortase-dependent surface protein [Streptomyces sp. FL07-04A]MDX3579417.1 LAETG motif-containing sortase-dependent surface protein [Streptomyces sp. FL07-04A]